MSIFFICWNFDYCMLKEKINNKLIELNSQDYHDIGTMCVRVFVCFVSIVAAIGQASLLGDFNCIFHCSVASASI